MNLRDLTTAASEHAQGALTRRDLMKAMELLLRTPAPTGSPMFVVSRNLLDTLQDQMGIPRFHLPQPERKP